MTLWSLLFPGTITRESVERLPSFLRYLFDLMPNAHRWPCPFALHCKFNESLTTHHNSALPFPSSFVPCSSPFSGRALQHVQTPSGFALTSCHPTGNKFVIYSSLSWRCRMIYQSLPRSTFGGPFDTFPTCDGPCGSVISELWLTSAYLSL